jgi:Cell wall-associated hydrolases (invasion-associated proteins)
LSIRSGIYTKKNVKANFIHYLPFGSKLHVKNIDNHWAEINLSNKHSHQTGYVPSKDIIKINEKVKDWVSIAEQFVGTPYRWGGRDSIGLDCSALVQLSYEFYGEVIPRNTKDQVEIKKEIIEDLQNLKRGYVVFWDGHVGIMVDNLKCLHSNAFHMKTIIEPLDDIIKRSGGISKITKILNFNC